MTAPNSLTLKLRNASKCEQLRRVDLNESAVLWPDNCLYTGL